MKNFIILLVVVFGAYAFLKSRIEANANSAPEVITDPVYAETRVSMKRPDGSVDMVVLMKTVDQSDCESQTRKLEKELTDGGFGTCTICTAPRSQCLAELPSRFVAMFENRPSSVTYLSLARGNQAERDLRVIYWGVTVEQSDSLCAAVPDFQRDRKGAVSCVRSRRG